MSRLPWALSRYAKLTQDAMLVCRNRTDRTADQVIPLPGHTMLVPRDELSFSLSHDGGLHSPRTSWLLTCASEADCANWMGLILEVLAPKDFRLVADSLHEGTLAVGTKYERPRYAVLTAHSLSMYKRRGDARAVEEVRLVAACAASGEAWARHGLCSPRTHVSCPCAGAHF